MTTSINTASELYAAYGKKYPYACDAIAYYIFDSRDEDNKVRNSILGNFGVHTEIDGSESSDILLLHEYTWKEYIEEIDEAIRNLPTKDGETLSFYY